MEMIFIMKKLSVSNFNKKFKSEVNVIKITYIRSFSSIQILINYLMKWTPLKSNGDMGVTQMSLAPFFVFYLDVYVYIKAKLLHSVGVVYFTLHFFSIK